MPRPQKNTIRPQGPTGAKFTQKTQFALNGYKGNHKATKEHNSPSAVLGKSQKPQKNTIRPQEHTEEMPRPQKHTIPPQGRTGEMPRPQKNIIRLQGVLRKCQGHKTTQFALSGYKGNDKATKQHNSPSMCTKEMPRPQNNIIRLQRVLRKCQGHKRTQFALRGLLGPSSHKKLNSHSSFTEQHKTDEIP